MRGKLVPIFIIFLAALVAGGAYLLNDRVARLREEKDTLTSELSILEADTDLLLAKKQVYTAAFTELESLNAGDGTAGAGSDLYSETQQAIRRGGSRIISNSPQPSGGVMRMGMSFAGDYYSTLRSLSELRALRNAVRVVSLQLSPLQPVGDVQLNVTLEAPN